MDIFLFGHPCFVRLLINLVQVVLPPFFSLKLLASGATMLYIMGRLDLLLTLSINLDGKINLSLYLLFSFCLLSVRTQDQKPSPECIDVCMCSRLCLCLDAMFCWA